MKRKLSVLTFVFMALLSSCQGKEQAYGVGAVVTTSRATFTYLASSLTESLATIDISVSKRNSDIQMLEYITAHNGPEYSYQPSVLLYNDSPVPLNVVADDKGTLILNYPIADDAFTLHAEYDMTLVKTAPGITQSLVFNFVFNEAVFKAYI